MGSWYNKLKCEIGNWQIDDDTAMWILIVLVCQFDTGNVFNLQHAYRLIGYREYSVV